MVVTDSGTVGNMISKESPILCVEERNIRANMRGVFTKSESGVRAESQKVHFRRCFLAILLAFNPKTKANGVKSPKGVLSGIFTLEYLGKVPGYLPYSCVA